MVTAVSDRDKVQIEDVGVAVLHHFQQRVRRRAVEVDACDGRLRAFENHVLGFLHVDLALAQVLEDVGQHTRPIAVAGTPSIPTDAVAVAANVTVTGPIAAGYLTVYPCGASRPTSTSNVNFVAGQTIAALVLSKLDVTGQLCLYSSAAGDVVVDITAWFPAGGSFDAITPVRLLDTRPTKTALTANRERVVPITALPGLPTGAAAYVLNVAAVDPKADGWLAVYPCDAGRGSTSTVNYRRGQTIANLTVTRSSTTGTVCLYSSANTDVIIDVTGSFPTGRAYVPIAPTRVMDTRSKLMHSRLGEDDTSEVKIRGIAGIPATATAVMANVTITNPEQGGYATLYPCAQVWPGTSNVNYQPGDSIPNLTFTQIGVNGCVRLYNEHKADAIVDVVGYLM